MTTLYFAIGFIITLMCIIKDVRYNTFDSTLNEYLNSYDEDKRRLAQFGKKYNILFRFIYLIVIFVLWPVVLYKAIKRISSDD